jgi:hypothetical protein
MFEILWLGVCWGVVGVLVAAFAMSYVSLGKPIVKDKAGNWYQPMEGRVMWAAFICFVIGIMVGRCQGV